MVVTIHDDDEHLFPALQAGAFGYILKEQARELIIEQLQRISQGEPPLSPSIARRVMAYFAAKAKPQAMSASSAACRMCRSPSARPKCCCAWPRATRCPRSACS